MSTFEILHFKNQELAKAYMQGVHDITEWLLKPSERTATNFDKVTASPEALAKFIDDKIRHTLDLDECPFVAFKCEEGVECEECITRWLKQEAADEEKE